MQTQEDLMERLAAPENLLTAWRMVRGNIPGYRRQRSSGPDGVSLTEFERDLPAQLGTLRHMLLKGRYQPQAPGLFTIAKRNGGTRQIAMLNVVDRVAQRATQQVIEPLYEPRFLPCSFGFRPGRSIQDAVYCTRQLRGHGYGWVVDGDIAACFDSLDHKLLINRVGKQISDNRVLDLIQRWLGIGIIENGLPADRPNWVAHGCQKASRGLRRGVDWALNTFTRPEPNYDPYSSARYEPSNYVAQDGDEYPETGEDSLEEAEDRFYQYPREDEMKRRTLQNRAIQQIATGGLFMGTSWARRSLTKAAPVAIAALKSPAGQLALKRVILSGGGALGAAAGVAVTTYFLFRKVVPGQVGVLQGSPLSPLLSNIYLHSFDVSITQAGYRLVRYADDWVILCPDQKNAEIAFNQATLALDRIHLKINREKTRILTPSDRLDWLGETVE